MSGDRLMASVDELNKLKSKISSKGMPDSEDTMEPLERKHEDVPTMLQNILSCKSTPAQVVMRARREINLWMTGM